MPGNTPAAIKMSNLSDVITGSGIQGEGQAGLLAGAVWNGTIKIREFIAIVHALAHGKKYNLTVPMYPDSKIPYVLIDRAVKWVAAEIVARQMEIDMKE